MALCGALGLYRMIGDEGLLWNIVGLCLIGGTLFAADSLVSGSAAQDIGGPHASALACGVVNGVGSVGGIAMTNNAWTVVDLGNTTVDELVFRNFAGSQWYLIEDLTLGAVPAPGALALLGIAGIVARRRRRA